jgi:hypothetical protein
MLSGSCLCGGIRYEIDAELGPVTNCHCSQCRKASGGSFATNASVPAAAFRFVAGAELLRSWESSPGTHRCFCGRCGSPILKRRDSSPDSLRLRLGTLDTDPKVRPSKHIYVGSKAAWVEITDDLPRTD